MKRIAFYTFIAVSAIFVAALFLNRGTAIGSKKTIPSKPGVVLPDSVIKFVQRACMDCHSDKGSAMARGKVNFSQWNSYPADKQVQKAAAVNKVMAKGDMPPKKWRANHPKDVPTPEEIKMIGDWATGLKK